MSSPINSQGTQPCYIFGKPPKDCEARKRREEPLLKQVLMKNACERVTVVVSDSDLETSSESIVAHQQQENNTASVGEDLLQVAQDVNAAAPSRMCTIL